MKKAVFSNCSLHEVDFTETDLSQAVFENCDFAGATFDQTILEKVDLRSSHHYIIDPENNRLKKAKVSSAELAGLLQKYELDIH
jgi:fluoroquinolone resistance protein